MFWLTSPKCKRSIITTKERLRNPYSGQDTEFCQHSRGLPHILPKSLLFSPPQRKTRFELQCCSFAFFICLFLFLTFYTSYCGKCQTYKSSGISVLDSDVPSTQLQQLLTHGPVLFHP